MTDSMTNARRSDDKKDANRLEIGHRIAKMRNRLINPDNGKPMSIPAITTIYPRYKSSRWKMWEAGFRAPTFDIIPDLALILNTNPGYLYLWTDDPSPWAWPSPGSIPNNAIEHGWPSIVLTDPGRKKLNVPDNYQTIEIEIYNCIFIVDQNDKNPNKAGEFIIKLGEDLKVIHIEKRLDKNFTITWYQSTRSETMTQLGVDQLTVIGRVRGHYQPLS